MQGTVLRRLRELCQLACWRPPRLTPPSPPGKRDIKLLDLRFTSPGLWLAADYLAAENCARARDLGNPMMVSWIELSSMVPCF